jgi:hypothetical protein
MLQQTHATHDVVTIKLVSGEEVIGYFVSSTTNDIILRKPVVPVPTADGKVGLAPYIMSSDYLQTGSGELGFNRQAVITITPTSQAFKTVYVAQVSGIDLPPNKPSGLISV